MAGPARAATLTLVGFLLVWPWPAVSAEAAARARSSKALARIGLRIFPVGVGPDDDPEAARAGAPGGAASLRLLRAALEEVRGAGFVLRGLGPDPGPEGLLPGAAQLEERARSLELALEFREAAVAWETLLDQMLSRPLLLTQPQRVARVQLALAAAQAEAGEPELALIGFRTALALDLDARLGPAYPPRARTLFAKARGEGSLLPPVPRPELLRALARARGLDAIVWVALGHDRGGEVLLRGFTRLSEGPDAPELRRALPTEPGPRARLIQQEARSLERLLRQAFPGPSPVLPWYRRTWVLASGGGLLVAASTTALLLRILSPARIDVVVQH